MHSGGRESRCTNLLRMDVPSGQTGLHQKSHCYKSGHHPLSFLHHIMFKLSSLFSKRNPRSNVSSHTVGQKTDIQDDIPPEIKRNILLCLDSLKDVKNLGETCLSFNIQAKDLQFRTLDLTRLLHEPNKLGNMRKIDELIKQLRLTKSAVRGAHPLSYYIREIQYLPPKNCQTIKVKQLSAVLNACDQLQVIKFAYLYDAIEWPEIIRTKKKLQLLYLKDGTRSCLHRYSFWSLLEALTTTSPDIETIFLEELFYSESQMPLVGADAATVARVARTHSPCRKLKTILSEDEVWTVPYLKYLTIMAPNLVEARLFLRRENNMTELISTLEASLIAWSKTLKSLCICHHHSDMTRTEAQRRQSHPITFPKMEKLEELALIGLQISSASLYNLNSLKGLILALTDHSGIIDALGRGHWHLGRPVLEKLNLLAVDRLALNAYYREGMIGRRNNVQLHRWNQYSLMTGLRSGCIHWDEMIAYTSVTIPT